MCKKLKNSEYTFRVIITPSVECPDAYKAMIEVDSNNAEAVLISNGIASGKMTPMKHALRSVNGLFMTVHEAELASLERIKELTEFDGKTAEIVSDNPMD